MELLYLPASRRDAKPKTLTASSVSVKGRYDPSSNITASSIQAPWYESGPKELEKGRSIDRKGSSLASCLLGKKKLHLHRANDEAWEAIRSVKTKDSGGLSLQHFRILKQIGCGDIGGVYLSELRSKEGCVFAMKVMDKGALGGRNKLSRSRTEREILESLDHPFLPTLYTTIESTRYICLVMEYCPGGDLHRLRQLQPGNRFDVAAARFYAGEVLLALEYLHMLGVVYRDLKPENVLVRGDGHIMLSDFDLSLKCDVSPKLIQSTTTLSALMPKKASHTSNSLSSYFKSYKKELRNYMACIPKAFDHKLKPEISKRKVAPLPKLVVEPTSVRSMSFVGTHEYLAPEIVSGSGHGSAVDWWTFGVFLYELIYGKTPFKGDDHEATLLNVLTKPLSFPMDKGVNESAKILIKGLLQKDPKKRLASARGAADIKQHPFFDGLNWALIRSMSPPQIPTLDSKTFTSFEYF